MMVALSQERPVFTARRTFSTPSPGSYTAIIREPESGWQACRHWHGGTHRARHGDVEAAVELLGSYDLRWRDFSSVEGERYSFDAPSSESAETGVQVRLLAGSLHQGGVSSRD